MVVCCDTPNQSNRLRGNFYLVTNRVCLNTRSTDARINFLMDTQTAFYGWLKYVTSYTSTAWLCRQPFGFPFCSRGGSTAASTPWHLYLRNVPMKAIAYHVSPNQSPRLSFTSPNIIYYIALPGRDSPYFSMNKFTTWKNSLAWKTASRGMVNSKYISLSCLRNQLRRPSLYFWCIWWYRQIHLMYCMIHSAPRQMPSLRVADSGKKS